MKGNIVSCVFGKTENEKFLCNNILMENSKEQKFFAVIVDDKSNFESHINVSWK